MIWNISSFVAVNLAVGLIGAGMASAETTPDAAVAVLECQFPIPNGYVGGGESPGEFLFTRSPDTAFDRIVISEYDESRWLTGDREIIEERQVGHLRFIRTRKRV